MKLKHFKIDPARDQLAVDVEFYQMDLTSVVNGARRNGRVTDDDLLPSWTKFNAAPPWAKGFFIYMLESVFIDKHYHKEVSIAKQFLYREEEKARCAIMFLGQIDNDFLDIAEIYAREALPGYHVKALYGKGTHKGKKITNYNSEKVAKETIEIASKEKAPVLFLASQMAQRSFSIPELTEVYLAYDGGENGATIQKMSRALTPYKPGKVGKVISLSFDPNRDDKFDALIIETALNYNKTHDKKSAKEAMRDVLDTIDIFQCTPRGSVKINVDAYLQQLTERDGGLTRVIGKIADLTQLTEEEIYALANGNTDYFRTETVAKTDKGKTRLTKKANKRGGGEKDLSLKEIQKAREAIVTIAENLDFIIHGTGADTLTSALLIIHKNKGFQQTIEETFGVPFALVDELLVRGVINREFVELQFDR